MSKPIISSALFLIIFLLIPAMSNAEQQNNASDKIRADLEMLSAGKGKIELLTVTYDEVRGPHNVMTLTIHGNGVVDAKTTNRSIGQPRMVTPPEMKKLVDVLYREKAWDQRMGPMQASDPGLVKLIISYDKDSSTIWEPYSELKNQKRIFNILVLMGQITSTSP